MILFLYYSMHAMHGCDTVHEFVLSHEFVLYWRIHYPYSIYIYPYVDSPEFDARDGRRDNDDERPFLDSGHSRRVVKKLPGRFIDTFVCMDKLMS